MERGDISDFSSDFVMLTSILVPLRMNGSNYLMTVLMANRWNACTHSKLSVDILQRSWTFWDVVSSKYSCANLHPVEHTDISTTSMHVLVIQNATCQCCLIFVQLRTNTGSSHHTLGHVGCSVAMATAHIHMLRISQAGWGVKHQQKWPWLAQSFHSNTPCAVTQCWPLNRCLVSELVS